MQALKVPKSRARRAGKTSKAVYIDPQFLGTVFDSKKLVRLFDRDKCINHPTKGRLILYPGDVILING